MFVILDRYFEMKDFEEINSRYITNLWKAKNEFKYHIFSQSPEYHFIVDYENQRNNRIVENIREVALNNPDKKILVAIGIDHKYYIEEMLHSLGVRV
jgi:hypothetical protein